MDNWIKAKVEKTFTNIFKEKMVEFSDIRQNGGKLTARESQVNDSLGNGWLPGLVVLIQIEDGNISKIKRVGSADQAAKKPTQGAHQHLKTPSPDSPLPYGFVPFNPQGVVSDTPVWHDGSNGGELLSGEILCSMEALTPFLAGNARYHSDLAQLAHWGFADLKPGKQIAEPLRLNDGRVVIAGSALKGMIRHSLGALLSVPMERVAERHYSYRPNLDFNRGEKENYVTRPALVVTSQNDGCTVEVFNNARAALFVRLDSEGIVQNQTSAGQICGNIRDIEISKNRIQKKIGSSANLDHRLAEYKGGIDGQGLLASAFNSSSKTYRLALVPKTSVATLKISAELYQRYLTGQKEVLANKKEGHLTAHPLHHLDVDSTARAIEQNSDLFPNQLIYVELKTDSGKVTASSKIVSFGHHFRYRWAYTSSVRKKGGQIRDCLAPTLSEQTLDDEGKPQTLTGARLLFGYVRNDDTPIGKGEYERLAGRIAFNHAVSQGVPSFLGEASKGYCVPLRILGQPKSSAWEFYLQQSGEGAPATYGDLPDDMGGDMGGELAGRKFYWHQPSVQTEADIEAKDSEIIKSDQATLARFICKPKTRFKFAIRFSQLRLWELGALVGTLEPHRVEEEDGATPDQYAHKLGLGRPLGMGSVRITIDKLMLRKTGATQLSSQSLEGSSELVNQAVQALLKKVFADSGAEAHLRRWSKVHRYSEGEKRDYPSASDGKIFTWHTELRREYSKLRRQDAPNWSVIQQKIMRHLP